MQTQMRAWIDITYDHAREVSDTDLASTIASAIYYMNTANLFDCTDEGDQVTLATPVAITVSIGTVWPGGATMRVSGTIVIKDVRERIEE